LNDPLDLASDRVTRDLIRAWQLVKIELLGHVIVGSDEKPFTSLRELGYFHI
jgi:DNA repair protein RadC